MTYKVMIVDDEPVVRDGIAGVFRMNGQMEVLTARNGEEALRTAEEIPIDGMVLDIKMPCKDGLQVLESISRDRSRMPVVIVLSGYDDFSYAQRAIPFGIADYVLKPLSPDKTGELASRLVALMERRRSGRDAKDSDGGKPTTSLPDGCNPVVEKMVAYIEEHLGEELSNEKLSDVFRYSQNYLGQIFKKETGIKFSEFVTTRRIDKAKRYLREKYMNVSEVAYKVGFKDNHYFYTVFKRMTGITPKEYRLAALRDPRFDN
jgi:two-component system, response regulator YesN